jgi:hypothetical protein
MWLSCGVVEIHELPLHIIRKSFLSMDVFQKTKVLPFPYFHEDMFLQVFLQAPSPIGANLK